MEEDKNVGVFSKAGFTYLGLGVACAILVVGGAIKAKTSISRHKREIIDEDSPSSTSGHNLKSSSSMSSLHMQRFCSTSIALGEIKYLLKKGQVPGKGEFQFLTDRDKAKNLICQTRNAGQLGKNLKFNR